jgi:CBS domain containing-hemolysin-like protein
MNGTESAEMGFVVWKLVATFAFVLVNGFFVAAEFALVAITMLHMTVGEQAPKMFSIQKAESAILSFALPLHLFATALKPMIWVINWLSNLLVRLAGGDAASEHQVDYDIAEVRAIINAADTIGGYVVSPFKHIPKRGESVEIGPFRVTVLSVSRRRVAGVRFEKTGSGSG